MHDGNVSVIGSCVMYLYLKSEKINSERSIKWTWFWLYLSSYCFSAEGLVIINGDMVVVLVSVVFYLLYWLCICCLGERGRRVPVPFFIANVVSSKIVASLKRIARLVWYDCAKTVKTVVITLVPEPVWFVIDRPRSTHHSPLTVIEKKCLSRENSTRPNKGNLDCSETNSLHRLTVFFALFRKSRNLLGISGAGHLPSCPRRSI